MARNIKPRKIKFSKIAIVMFLTVLIWVYADLALDDTHMVPNVSISIAKSGDSEVWATFKNEDGAPVASIALEHIVLKGPASRIAEVKRHLNSALLTLAFSLNPEMENMITAGSNTLDVLDFVRKSEQIRGLGGLSVEVCEPNRVTVDVVRLVKKKLEIQSVDESGRTLAFETISPSEVSMFVPEDWGQDKKAEVKLTPSEIVQARVNPVPKKPYVVLADNRERRSVAAVQVKLRPEEDDLEHFTIKEGVMTVGYIYSANMQGVFKAQMQQSDESDLTGEIKIMATLAAKTAFEKQAFQVIVEIHDSDDSGGAVVRRPVRYNLPEEYVRKGEIKLDPAHQPVEAKFTLTKVSSGDGS